MNVWINIGLIILGLITLFFLFTSSKKNKKIKLLLQKLDDEKNQLKQEIKLINAKHERALNLNQEEKKLRVEYESKYKTLWNTSLKVHRQKEDIEDIAKQLKTDKEKVESAYKDKVSKIAKLWQMTLAIKKEEEKVIKMKEIVDEHNRHMIDSITYAKIIQEAILPRKIEITKSFPEHFIYFSPKDIVSGDFYWTGRVKLKNGDSEKHLLALVDCTGHGVPGAFMSMIGNAILNQVIQEKGITEPGKALDALNANLKRLLHRDHEEQTESRDGMDVALCCVDYEKSILSYAGAHRSLYFFKKKDNESELILVNGDKMGVGDDHIFSHRHFKTTDINISKGDRFYIFSDGFPDQFGGPLSKKYRSKNVQKFFESIQLQSMERQFKLLIKEIKDWKGAEIQTDDVLIMGVEI